MAYAMTKQGSLDNCITYEFICDTTADMNAIENRYRTIGTVAIVLQGESEGLEVYIAGSNKQWHSLGGFGGGTAADAGLSIYICTSGEVANGVPNIQEPDETTIYLVSSENETGNLYEEYIYVNNAWEKFGAASIDLSGYVVKQNAVVTDSLSMGRKANTTIGPSSTALGGDVTASADQAHAEGYSTTASNYQAHAEGLSTIASGTQSHAEGTSTTASGRSSHAEGNSTTASGDFSHTEGLGGTYTSSGTTYTSAAVGTADHTEGYQCLTAANQPGNHAEGYQTRATGGAAHSEGSYTLASGLNAHAEGLSTTASGSQSHAEGINTTAVGQSAHAEGLNTTAVGQCAHAEGLGGTYTYNGSTYTSIASGDESHTEGLQCIASVAAAHAEGSMTRSTGYAAHAEGNYTLASNQCSHAEGYGGTFISGGVTYTSAANGVADHVEGYSCYTSEGQPGNHAEGYSTRATGGAAHSEGNYTLASGVHSHAEGNSTTASGSQSHVEGNNTQATGTYSHAEGCSSSNSSISYGARGKADHIEGYNTLANSGSTSSYYGAHAEGNSTKATNGSAHAEGASTTASGYASHAEGYSSTASSSYSHAEGNSTKATLTAAHAEGYYTQATGNYSHAEGYSTSNSSTSYGARGKADHVEGYNTLADSGSSSSQYGAHAEGKSTKATSSAAHAEGTETTASGRSSHAEGAGTIASGNQAHAEGNSSTASGQDSHAEGNSTKATSSSAHAEGCSSIASGQYSHAEGYYTKASGFSSHAEGYYTIANEYQHVFGLNNREDSQVLVEIPALGDIAEFDPARLVYLTGSVVKYQNTIYVAHAIAPTKHSSPKYDTYNWHVYSQTPPENTPEWEEVQLYTTINSIVKVTEANGTISYYQNHNAITEPYIYPGTGTSGVYWHQQEVGSTYASLPNYAEIVGNGAQYTEGANARVLDWSGNEHLAGDLYVKCNADSTGGVKVATLNDIPSIPAAPSADGTYVLQCTVTNGTPAYSWMSMPDTTGVSF